MKFNLKSYIYHYCFSTLFNIVASTLVVAFVVVAWLLLLLTASSVLPSVVVAWVASSTSVLACFAAWVASTATDLLGPFLYSTFGRLVSLSSTDFWHLLWPMHLLCYLTTCKSR